jgi:hypothetical protein
MSDNKNKDWKERELGALWIKESPKGSKFLSGTINGKRVSVWKNKFYEEGSKVPYYRVYDDSEYEKDEQKESPSKEAPSSQRDLSDGIPF